MAMAQHDELQLNGGSEFSELFLDTQETTPPPRPPRKKYVH